MYITHICLTGPYTDGWNYQDNMLTKYHAKMGLSVTVLAPNWSYNEKGHLTKTESGEYTDSNGVKIIRISTNDVYHKFKRYKNLGIKLAESHPDILFIHGCQFLDMDVIVKYLKSHPNIRVYVDNHADFSNSGTNLLSKNILHKGFWKHSAQIINPYTTKFYGVLPARVDWLVNMYGLPREKCELLVMGADDEKVKEAYEDGWKSKIRGQYGIEGDDFLIMTGGKIDAWKTQTILLMEAVKRIDNPKVKLIVFGSVTSELKDRVNALVDGNKVQYIGWVKSEDSYYYWAACDLAVFPGRHSVFWEQVAGMGIPMVCKYWDGTTHVDVGGNVVFLKEDSIDEIENAISILTSDGLNKYKTMKTVAEGQGKNMFSYMEISKRALEETVAVK